VHGKGVWEWNSCGLFPIELLQPLQYFNQMSAYGIHRVPHINCSQNTFNSSYLLPSLWIVHDHRLPPWKYSESRLFVRIITVRVGGDCAWFSCRVWIETNYINRLTSPVHDAHTHTWAILNVQHLICVYVPTTYVQRTLFSPVMRAYTTDKYNRNRIKVVKNEKKRLNNKN
jgi:hypothetical protein